MNRINAEKIINKLKAGKPVKLRMSKYSGLTEKTFNALTGILWESFENIQSVGFEYSSNGIVNQRKAKLKVIAKNDDILFESDLITLYK